LQKKDKICPGINQAGKNKGAREAAEKISVLQEREKDNMPAMALIKPGRANQAVGMLPGFRRINSYSFVRR